MQLGLGFCIAVLQWLKLWMVDNLWLIVGNICIDMIILGICILLRMIMLLLHIFIIWQHY